MQASQTTEVFTRPFLKVLDIFNNCTYFHLRFFSSNNTLSFLGRSLADRFFLFGVSIVITLSRPLSRLPNILAFLFFWLLSTWARLRSNSTEWNLLHEQINQLFFLCLEISYFRYVTKILPDLTEWIKPKWVQCITRVSVWKSVEI